MCFSQRYWGQKPHSFLVFAIIILAFFIYFCNIHHPLIEVGDYRDADHLTNLVYDFDCHTLKGKRKGKTKEDFFIEEFDALKPRQPGLFDEFVPKKNS